MAGYVTKHNGYQYNGEMTNGATGAIENGVLMVPSAGKLVFATAESTTKSKFTLLEKTEVYGVDGYRFRVDSLAGAYYFVENQFEINDSDAYDVSTYTTAAGAYLRAHPLSVGEEFVTTKITGTLAVGTAYGVAANGAIGA